MAIHTEAGDGIAIVIEIHIAGGVARCFFAVIERNIFAISQVSYEETAAADIAGCRVYYGQRQLGGNSGIDGITSQFSR